MYLPRESSSGTEIKQIMKTTFSVSKTLVYNSFILAQEY